MALIYCSESEQVIFKPLSANQFQIIQIHVGEVTELITADYLPGGLFNAVYSENVLTVATDTGNVALPVAVKCNKVFQVRNVNPTPAGQFVYLESLLIGTDRAQGYPYDIFIEEGVNLRPLVENLMAELTDTSDYTSYSLRSIEVYIDCTVYGGKRPGDKQPTWQTPGFEVIDIKFWNDFLKTKLGQSFRLRSYDPRFMQIFYDDGTGMSQYVLELSRHFMALQQLINNEYTYPGIFNDPILMDFSLQVPIPIVPDIADFIECRTGINIYLKAVGYTTKDSYTIQHTTIFGITGYNRGGIDEQWGGGWGGGVSLFGEQSYTAVYTFVMARSGLFISPCATEVTFQVAFEMAEDPVLDHDGDPETPPQKVPQIYNMLAFIVDVRSNQTIGSYSWVEIGEGLHLKADKFYIQPCLPLQEEREIRFSLDNQNVQQKAAYPHKLTSINFSTNDCEG
jgi:hypothetical protein